MQALQSQAIFFCHGFPGSEHDVRLLQELDDDTPIISPNLLSGSSGDSLKSLVEKFDELTADFEDRHIGVVGFSIGAMVAIKIAAARPNRVGKLTLISPAAPLSLGNFLPDMAGAPVFRAARSRPNTLKVITFAQGLLFRLAPHFLINQLFAKCGEAERRLIKDNDFLDVLHRGFSNSYISHPGAYIQYLRAYVEDWSLDLAKLVCAVEIWHGENHTWSPLSMSKALREAIGRETCLHIVPAAEHFSTLLQARVQPICDPVK